jgi:2-dehydropantoate 2-reductase
MGRLCVYCGRLNEPGVLKVREVYTVCISECATRQTEKLRYIEKLMLDAGIKANLTPEIGKIIWRKFIFISTTATLTSYFNVGFRDLLTDSNRKEITLKIIREVSAIAHAEGITFDSDIVETTVSHIERLPLAPQLPCTATLVQAKTPNSIHLQPL